jgi:uncharacterized protein
MKTLFADTFYFIALLSPRDLNHQLVNKFTDRNSFCLLTTDWVLTELGNALSGTQIERLKFSEVMQDLLNDTDVTIVPSNRSWFLQGLKLHSSRPDKRWSLTDCISFLVMQEHGINEALTGDHHFEQAGFTAIFK